MTKQEAIQVLNEGATVRHEYFNENEWVRQEGLVMFFEDGVQQSVEEYWKLRTASGWNEGWSIFVEKVKEEKLNTVSDPLNVIYRRGEYKCSKPDDQSGAYVDLSLAQQSLEVLEYVLKVIEDSDHWWISSPDKGGFDVNKIQEAIKKIKG